MSNITRSAAIGSIAAALPAAAMATTAAPSANSARWDALMARYLAAFAASDEHDEKHFKPAFAGMRAEREKLAHFTTTTTFQTNGGDQRALTTARIEDVHMARRVLGNDLGRVRAVVGGAGGLDDFIVACTEVVAAADARDAELKAIDRRWRMDELGGEADDLVVAYSDAEDELMAEPAPHVGALLWKLERLLRVEMGGEGSTGSWSAHYVEQPLADMRRLLGSAA